MRRPFRLIECSGCGGEVTLLVAGMDPAECRDCGAWFDHRTGEMLPVCEGVGYRESASISLIARRNA